MRLLVARASQRVLLYGGDEAEKCWEERWRWSERILHPSVVILVQGIPKLVEAIGRGFFSCMIWGTLHGGKASVEESLKVA